MPARRYQLTPAAEADLEHIWLYSFRQWSVEQSDRYHRQIMACCAELAGGARQGRPVDIRPGLLKHLVGSHVVYFRDNGDRIEVIRVLHQREDVGRNL